MFNFEKDYDWRGLIAASGPPGSLWVELYSEKSTEIQSIIRASAACLRQHQFKQSLALLEQAESHRQNLRSGHPSIFHVIGRFYFGGLAYHYYCLKNFLKSDQIMIETHKSIQAAIECDQYLLPLAALNLDIPLKRARISQAQHRWKEMREHVRVLQHTIEDCRPLCVLSGRIPVHYSTIASLFTYSPTTEERLAPAIHFLSDSEARKELLLHFLAQLYTPPGLLISYP